MSERKTGYKDIIIYTITIFIIIYLRGYGYISYNLMVVLLVAALGMFALYNIRHKIKALFKGKK